MVMSELRALLADTAEKVFHRLEEETDFQRAWSRASEAGLSNVAVREDMGGFGGGFEDAVVVLRKAGLHASGLPIAEAVVARAILCDEGATLSEQPVSFAACASGSLSRSANGLSYSGEAKAVPWGGACQHIVLAAAHSSKRYLLVLPTSDAVRIAAGKNLAGESRDDLYFDGAPARAIETHRANDDFLLLATLARTAQMSGALDRTLALTIDHVKTREQFGRTLASFQAVQQQLAIFASEAAAVECAVTSAARARDGGDAGFEIAAAKLRANKAVDVSTSIAHQLHGAIGITREHALHRFTQRLWAWKSEYGNDRFWALRLGASACTQGADSLWPHLTGRDGHHRASTF
jgi:acyl-CoA dehydrogenase